MIGRLRGSGSPLAVTVAAVCSGRAGPADTYWLGMFTADANMSGEAAPVGGA